MFLSDPCNSANLPSTPHPFSTSVYSRSMILISTLEPSSPRICRLPAQKQTQHQAFWWCACRPKADRSADQSRETTAVNATGILSGLREDRRQRARDHWATITARCGALCVALAWGRFWNEGPWLGFLEPQAGGALAAARTSQTKMTETVSIVS